MTISRRHALQLTATCLTHVFLNAACAPRRVRSAWTAPLNPTVTTTPFARLDAIGPDTWAVISTPLGGDRTTFGNGGIIAGRSGVIAVDGYYRPAGAEWLARQARALTGRWPTHVVLTHYHTDHAGGVQGFVAEGERTPRLHSTGVTREDALGGGPVAPAKSEALSRAFADIVLLGADTPTTIDLGNRVVVLDPMQGHTRSDVALIDEDAGLTFAGDLVWNGMFPNFTDARPTQLSANAKKLSALVRSGARSTLVPGHGGMVDADAMSRYRGLLDDLERAARAGQAAGKTAAETAAAYVVPASLGNWMASKAAVERAITAWSRELGVRGREY